MCTNNEKNEFNEISEINPCSLRGLFSLFSFISYSIQDKTLCVPAFIMKNEKNEENEISISIQPPFFRYIR